MVSATFLSSVNKDACGSAAELIVGCHCTEKPPATEIASSPKATTWFARISADKFSAVLVPAASMMITTSNERSLAKSVGTSNGESAMWLARAGHRPCALERILAIWSVRFLRVSRTALVSAGYVAIASRQRKARWLVT